MRQDFKILVLELKFSKTNRLVIGTCKPASLSMLPLHEKLVIF